RIADHAVGGELSLAALAEARPQAGEVGQLAAAGDAVGLGARIYAFELTGEAGAEHIALPAGAFHLVELARGRGADAATLLDSAVRQVRAGETGADGRQLFLGGGVDARTVAGGDRQAGRRGGDASRV